jgi:hypothetical protein
VNRRAFLKWMLAAPAIAATVDVEQLLWMPTPMVTVPAMPTVMFNGHTFTSLRLVKQYDVFTDRMVSRMDVLYGVATVQRQYNHAMSKAVEQIALAPKPPFIDYEKISMQYRDGVISRRPGFDWLAG